jgi:serine/threonine protein kinase
MSFSPRWWTSTAKAKAIVGVVLGMRFAHSLGLLHGHLTAKNVVFDGNDVAHIADFSMNRFAEPEGNSDAMIGAGGFSGNGWTPTADIRAFTEIFSKIVIDPSSRRDARGSEVPKFVSKIIKKGMSETSGTRHSFREIFTILSCNRFEIMKGVNSDEVLKFVKWVQSLEESMH